MALMSARDFANSPSQVAAERAAGIYRSTPTTPAPSMPQAYTPPASSSNGSSGGTSPWNNYHPIGAATSTPSAYVASAGNYTSGVGLSTPAPAYTGSSSVIGNTNSFGSDMNKGYQSIYDSVRAADPSRNQINTWADNKGNVYDTTKQTPQQIFAMSLSKDGNQNAAAILKGMGLDMNGNPTTPAPMYSATATRDPQGSSVNYPGMNNMDPGFSMTPVKNIDPGFSISPGKDMYPGFNIGTQLIPGYMQGGSKTASATATPMSQSGTSGAGSIADLAKSRIDAILQGGKTSGQGAGTTQLPGGGVIPQSVKTAPNNPYGIPNEQYAALEAQAQAQIDQQRAPLSQSVQSAIAGLTNTKDYTTKIEADKRASEDFNFKNHNDPFSGNTSYLAAENLRNRSIQDTAANKDYTSQISSLQQKLTDFDSGSAAQKQAIVQGLAKELAQFHMQEAGLTGTYNGQQTQAAKAQQSSTDIAKAGVTGYYQDTQNVAAVQKQMAANSAAYASASPAEQQILHDANVKLAASIGGKDTTGNGDYSFGQGQRTVAGQTLDYQHARDQIADERYKQKFDQDTKQWGLDFALKQAYEAGQLKISQQNASNSATSTANSNENAKARLEWDKNPDNPANKLKESTIDKNGNPAPNKNDLESQYISGFESLTPAKRAEALQKEKAAIVKDIGTSGYNSLYNMYLDSNGDPK